MEKRIIIGIDPGSRCTGYGIICIEGSRQSCLIHGDIRVRSLSLCERLRDIEKGIREVIETYNPTEAAIEQVFTLRNPQSALKLGQARAAALIALSPYGLKVHEYSARQVKLAVVGYGAATKIQVQNMMVKLLKLTSFPRSDAADALAIALCHANSVRLTEKLIHMTHRKNT